MFPETYNKLVIFGSVKRMPNNKKKDGLIMQAGILAVAGIIVRIIGLLYNTPLTNIIGDEGFGYYSNAYTAYSIVLLISSYSIPSAVSKVIAQKLAKREYRNAHRIFQCALIYVLVVGGIASLFVFFFASYMVDLGGSVLPLRILAPTIFFSGILGVFRGYFQAHKSMVQTSVSQILEQIVNAGVSVLMAYLLVRMVKGESETTQASFGAAGGTIGTGAGVVFALLFMMGVYALNKGMIHRQIDRDKTIHEDSRKEIFKMIIMVVTPFILSTAIYNINTFLDQKIYQMISLTIQQKTEAAVSFDLSAMAKATKLANIPIALASAMATALIPGISSDFARGDLEGAKSKVSRSVKVTMFISIPAAVGMGVLSRPCVQVIFHQKASLDISAAMLAVLAVRIMLYGLSTLTQAVLQSIGKMNTPIINALLALIIHAVIMVLGMVYLAPEWGLYCYAGSSVIYAFLLCIFNGISVRKHLKYKQEVDRTFIRPILCSVLMGAVAYGTYFGLYQLFPINLVCLAVAIGLACAVYFVLVIRWRAITEEEMKGLPKGTLLIKIAKKTHLLKPEAPVDSLANAKPGKIRAKKSAKKSKTSAERAKAQNSKIQNSKIQGEKEYRKNKKVPEATLPTPEDEGYWLDD